MKKAILAAAVLAICGQAWAEVKLPAVLCDNMVLQRDLRAPIWGKADAGEKVTVTFAGQSKEATADAAGKWRVDLPAMAASAEPRTLTVKGSNTIELKNILVGEVWVCSGQSNMAFTVSRSTTAKEAMEGANLPEIRLFQAARKVKPAGQDVEGKWEVCSPKAVGNFSAAGFYFGRELHAQLKVPVGLIDSSWGGTPAEAWTPDAQFEADASLKPILEGAKAQIRQLGEEKPKAGPAATRPARPTGQNTPTVLYHSMIEPIVPVGIRGAIWYQGEANAKRAKQYETLLPAMITGWRTAWGQGDFPFGIVQLPGFHAASDAPEDNEWSRLREAQRQIALKGKNIGLAVTIELGDEKDIHPKNKLDVGKRLALWALADVYGQKVIKGGPVIKESRVEGGRMVLTFDQVGEGLKVKGEGELKEFAVAGPDKQFYWAKAKVVGKNQVEVWSDEVKVPQAVRYAWNDFPRQPNLANSAGLPAGPFRTDGW